METTEQISEEWSCLISGVYTGEEADFMNQMLGNCSVPEQLYERFNLEPTQSAFWPAHESTADSSKYFFTATNGGTGNYSNNTVTNSGHRSIAFPFQGNEGKQMNENTDQEFGLDTGKEIVADMNLQAHMERNIIVSEPEKDKTRSPGKSEKRSSSSFEVPKNKRNVKSKKNPKPASLSNTKEDTSPDPQSQTLSSSCSDDNSKLRGKSRSSRNPATDPQSAYARRRRERINERLRILQNLVPNGTKVDISTMLEGAVEYVKFLQLQIKLLSSDDLWMYAPIAYNGMNIDLELNINTTK